MMEAKVLRLFDTESIIQPLQEVHVVNRVDTDVRVYNVHVIHGVTSLPGSELGHAEL